MYTVGVNRGHNSSATLLEDGNVVFHIENERYSNIKYDWHAFGALSRLPNYTNSIDQIAIAGSSKLSPADSISPHDLYTTYIKNLKRSFLQADVMVGDYGLQHHLTHASTAFYNSGFDRAVVVILDGMGSEYPINDPRFNTNAYGRESLTVFTSEYPDRFNVIKKIITVPIDVDVVSAGVEITGSPSEAYAFTILSKALGWHGLEAGKVMGMSSYGRPDSSIPSIYKNGRINRDLFSFGKDLSESFLNYTNYPNLKTNDFQQNANLCYALQHATQEHILKIILESIKQTGINNVCLSGGYFLNCVANYYILKNLPAGVNLYVEPISSDSGNAYGAAKLMWHSVKKDTTSRPLKSLYLGPENNYTIEELEKKLDQEKIVKDISSEDVAQLLADKNIVALFQGRSECGPRALGNRSLLYDPRDENGKNVVNEVKKREWFRPFAGTVLFEHAREWFDLHTLDESPFMMYAVDVIKEGIPAITHVDKTCRVQTLKQTQNEAFYNLIDAFYKKTNVPILLNTSLNLAGDCIVETLDDALNFLRQSKVKYLYLPNLRCLVVS